MRWSNEEDKWRWNLEKNGCYSMKQAYSRLEGLMLCEDVWGVVEKRVFEIPWNSPAPSKWQRLDGGFFLIVSQLELILL